MSDSESPSDVEPISLDSVKTYSIASRKSRVDIGAFAKPVPTGSDLKAWLETLPDILMGRAFRQTVAAVRQARENGRPILFMMGGHVIKCGLAPVVNQLISEGFVTAVAMNGAAAIHDYEIACFGQTSEDVSAALEDGSFGMADETGAGLNEAAKHGKESGRGFGSGLMHVLKGNDPPHSSLSIVCHCAEQGVPVTVHVAIGTDIVHQHPSAEGGAIGEASFTDFRKLCSIIAELEGGVVLHFGSAVVLPEVFLKALTVARNLGHRVQNFTAANFDMHQHYRPRTNVVERPTRQGGEGYSFSGHHEIMLPLLAASLLSG